MKLVIVIYAREGQWYFIVGGEAEGIANPLNKSAHKLEWFLELLLQRRFVGFNPSRQSALLQSLHTSYLRSPGWKELQSKVSGFSFLQVLQTWVKHYSPQLRPCSVMPRGRIRVALLSIGVGGWDAPVEIRWWLGEWPASVPWRQVWRGFGWIGGFQDDEWVLSVSAQLIVGHAYLGACRMWTVLVE